MNVPQDPKSLGTPKSLMEAIHRALCIGPLFGAEDRVKQAVRDFAAQKFGAALLQAKNDEEARLVSDLWESLTGERLHRVKTEEEL